MGIGASMGKVGDEWSGMLLFFPNSIMCNDLYSSLDCPPVVFQLKCSTFISCTGNASVIGCSDRLKCIPWIGIILYKLSSIGCVIDLDEKGYGTQLCSIDRRLRNLIHDGHYRQCNFQCSTCQALQMQVRILLGGAQYRQEHLLNLLIMSTRLGTTTRYLLCF